MSAQMDQKTIKILLKIDSKTIQIIEDSKFYPISKIYWRNSSLVFSDLVTFLGTLNQFPVYSYLIHKKNAADELNFRFLIEDESVKKILTKKDIIKLLWDVCRIPDFQKLFNDSYLQFLKTIFWLQFRFSLLL